MPVTAYIALGSNLGDRRAQLDRALELLRGRPGVVVGRVSAYRETEPVGGPAGQGQYLNAGYPFFIETHTGGSNIHATLRTTIAAPGGGFRSPAAGPVTLQTKDDAPVSASATVHDGLRPAPVRLVGAVAVGAAG